jgi:hypothetical protein
MPDAIQPVIQPADDTEKAFCEAVERYSAGEWSPGRPDHPQIAAGHDLYSIRGVCALVHGNPHILPERTIDQLFQAMHAQHDRLRRDLREFSTYAMGAGCLIVLMGEREATYKEKEQRRR